MEELFKMMILKKYIGNGIVMIFIGLVVLGVMMFYVVV